MLPIGNRIRQLRNEKSLSQNKLARKVGINGSTIALYETGDRFPSLPVLVELSRVLGVSTDYLLGVSDCSEHFLDVSGLTDRQLYAVSLVVETYREQQRE